MCKTRLYEVPLALQCVYGCNDERDDDGDGEDRSEVSGGEWRLHGLLYADDLVLCDSQSCRGRRLKVNAGKS